jgi:hypothetical protein
MNAVNSLALCLTLLDIDDPQACDVSVFFFLLDTVPFRIVQNHKEGDE